MHFFRSPIPLRLRQCQYFYIKNLVKKLKVFKSEEEVYETFVKLGRGSEQKWEFIKLER